MSAEEIALAKRKRGASRRSVTHLTKKLKDLEDHQAGDPTALTAAVQLKKNLKRADDTLRARHLELIELFETDADMDKEHEALDTHDETMNELHACVDRLLDSCTTQNSKL